MPGSAPRKRSVEKVTRERFSIDDEQTLSLHRQVREYLDGDLSHLDSLKEYLFHIQVYRIDAGRKRKLRAVYQDITTVLEQIGDGFGDGQYELYINVTPPEGKTKFTRYIADLEGYEPREQEFVDGLELEGGQDRFNPTMFLIQQMQENQKQQNAMMLKMMETMASLKSSGGQRSSISEALELVDYIDGKRSEKAGDPDDDGSGLMKTMGPLLAAKLINSNNTPAGGPPANVPRSPSGQSGPPPEPPHPE